jgi:hypothetical protein
VISRIYEELENRYRYHSPKSNQVRHYHKIGDMYKQLALLIKILTPSYRALICIDYVMANVAIARNDK